MDNQILPRTEADAEAERKADAVAAAGEWHKVAQPITETVDPSVGIAEAMHRLDSLESIQTTAHMTPQEAAAHRPAFQRTVHVINE